MRVWRPSAAFNVDCYAANSIQLHSINFLAFQLDSFHSLEAVDFGVVLLVVVVVVTGTLSNLSTQTTFGEPQKRPPDYIAAPGGTPNDILARTSGQRAPVIN